jgi:hypothetical protein
MGRSAKGGLQVVRDHANPHNFGNKKCARLWHLDGKPLNLLLLWFKHVAE